MYVYIYIYMYICIYIYIYIYMYVYIVIFACTCTDIHIYIYTYAHTYIYIYIYICSGIVLLSPVDLDVVGPVHYEPEDAPVGRDYTEKGQSLHASEGGKGCKIPKGCIAKLKSNQNRSLRT